MHVMPFCYNKELINSHISVPLPFGAKKDKIEFSYIGISVGNRNLQDIIEASNRLLAKEPQYRGKFQVNIIGNFLPIDSSLITKYGLNDVIVHKGYFKGEKLQKAYRDTDVFVVVDSPMKVNVFFPSKLLDYFYHQKPILGITSKQGVTNDLLTEAGHVAVENRNIDAIVEYIRKVVDNYDNVLHFNKDFYMTFSPEAAKMLYSNIVASL